MPDDPADGLYDGDAADFIARRDALAKQLKKDGDKEGAAAVKALRKPSAAAWAINQVAQAKPDLVDELLRAGVRLYDAQSRAVEGKDDGSLRTATQERRELVRRLAHEVAPQFRDDAAAS